MIMKTGFDLAAHHQAVLSRLLDDIRFPGAVEPFAFEFAGARFEIVTTGAAFLDALALRFTAYQRCRYIDPSDFPLHSEFDDLDDVSVHFVARDVRTSQLVGYARLILDGAKRLEVDQTFSVSDYRARCRGRLCEMSRLIVWPPERPGISHGIQHAALWWAERQGIGQVLAVSRWKDRAECERRRFFAMDPPRQAIYHGAHFGLLRGELLYGTVFDVDANGSYIAGLLTVSRSA